MSKFVEAVDGYKKDLDEMGIKYDADLLTKVAKGCGPSIYNSDSKFVSFSDQAELDRVKTNFLTKKLGLSESDDLDGALAKVKEQYTKRIKKRAIVYYLLVKHYAKESMYA